MKKTYLFFILLFTALIFNAFDTPQTPVEAIKENYLHDLGAFENTLKKLQTTAQKHPLSTNALQADFKAARKNVRKSTNCYADKFSCRVKTLPLTRYWQKRAGQLIFIFCAFPGSGYGLTVFFTTFSYNFM